MGPDLTQRRSLVHIILLSRYSRLHSYAYHVTVMERYQLLGPIYTTDINNIYIILSLSPYPLSDNVITLLTRE
jgi:hypothetical protein